MTTITLEVPDELVAQLKIDAVMGAALLREALAAKIAKRKEVSKPTIGTGITHPVYQQMLDFLATRPLPEQIIAYKISTATQERLEDLLDKNREEELTEAENAELDVYELVHHSLIRLKARARLASP